MLLFDNDNFHIISHFPQLENHLEGKWIEDCGTGKAISTGSIPFASLM